MYLTAYITTDWKSVSCFQEKEKGGKWLQKMITLNDIINDNTHAVQGKIITQQWYY